METQEKRISCTSKQQNKPPPPVHCCVCFRNTCTTFIIVLPDPLEIILCRLEIVHSQCILVMLSRWCCAIRSQSEFLLCSGVTRGGQGGWVAHPWRFLGEILEGRRKWWKRDGRGKKGERGKERQGKREMERKKKGKVWKFLEDFFFFFACHFLKPVKFVWGVPKLKFWGEIV